MRSRLVLGLAVCVLGAGSVQASAVTNRHITGIITVLNRYLVYFDGSADAGCTLHNRYELDGSTAMGQTNVATILTAYSLNKTVDMSGTGGGPSGGVCTTDTEYLYLLNVH